MRIKPYKHNQTTCDPVFTMLAQVGKAAVIYLTGTGKSKLCENFPGKIICWLSPSEYIFKA